MNESTSSSEPSSEQPTDAAASNRSGRSRSGMKSPGELVREARLAQDWSVEDLCAETKLSEASVAALEENRFDDLSQPIFAGGYYRQCAKVLDIDVDRMNDAYAAWGGKKTSSAAAQPSTVDIAPQDVTPPNWQAFAAIGAVVLLALLAGLYFLMPGGGDTESAEPASSTIGSGGDSSGFDEPAPEQRSATVGSGNSSATGGSSPAASRDSGTSLRVSSGSGNSAEGTDSRSSVANGSGSSAPTPSTGERAGGRNVNESLGIDREAERRREQERQQQNAEPQVSPNLLVVEFVDRSWVDIRDAGGERLLTGIFESGDSREFDGEAPYRITLGYAPGVNMTIGGESVDIESQTTSNSTARLTVEARDG